MDSDERDVEEKVRSILASLAEDERRLLSRVIDVERDKLHMKTPHGIYDELIEAINETIQ